MNRNSDQPLSILIVDDDRMCRRILEVLLKQLGHDADMAEDAEEALSKATKNRYDIIFLDIGLPNTSGIDFAKSIRFEYKQDAVLVATTGHVLDTDHGRYDSAGISFVFEKPIDFEKLEQFMADYVAVRS